MYAAEAFLRYLGTNVYGAPVKCKHCPKESSKQARLSTYSGAVSNNAEALVMTPRRPSIDALALRADSSSCISWTRSSKRSAQTSTDQSCIATFVVKDTEGHGEGTP
jgi:hypothetical protein